MFDGRRRIIILSIILAAFCQNCYMNMDEFVETSEAIFFPNASPLLASSFNDSRLFSERVAIQFDSIKDDKLGRAGDESITLSYNSNGDTIICTLSRGVSQNDIIKVRDGSITDKIIFSLEKPQVVSSRIDLNKIYKLARRRPTLFGEGDVAFYDLAEMMVKNMRKDSTDSQYSVHFSEYGYINTYNHVVAQALITIIYSDAIADSIACYHERIRSDELISPLKHEELSQMHIDNYVDIINNEIGQRLGLAISNFLLVNRHDEWNPQKLSKVLNLLQSYFSRHFHTSFEPFRPNQREIIRFTQKINIVNAGVPIILD